jgi:uncharacterized membrane protein/glutaredoxin
MIEVTLYTRNDCHLCELAQQYLTELQSSIPHTLTTIDIDTDPKLQKMYGFNVPVVVIGPYKISAPIEKKDLEISLLAVKHSQEQEEIIMASIKEGQLKIPVTWTRADQFSLWIARHYLAIFNILVFIYVGMSFFAPILMKFGVDKPAGVIYRVYGYVCHQVAFRSWFLFGEQIAYPREAAGITSLKTYEETISEESDDLLLARQFIGNPEIGYKVALCQRDVAIYGGILLFGILFSLLGRKIKSIHWVIWLLLGIAPIAIDGISQLLSQPPLSILPYRESTPLLRTITGFLFGFMTAWFGYPYVEESMSENRKYLESKLLRYKKSQDK